MDADLSYTARLREVVQRCLLESHQQTPENTRRAYAPKQKEWKVKKHCGKGMNVLLWSLLLTSD